MYRILLLLNCLLLLTLNSFAQIGAGHMAKMNAFLQLYGGETATTMKYEPNYGLVHQTIVGYTDHFTISNIRYITVHKVEEGYTVEFSCDSTNPCINHIGPNNQGTNLSEVIYSFTQEKPANSFARLAAEIIRTDFKKKVNVSYTSIENPPKEVVKKQVEKTKKAVVRKKPKGSHLSMDAYGDDGEQDFKRTLSEFGKRLLEIHQLAIKKQLNVLNAGELKGVQQSKLKLPKAKRNYLNQYKGEDCFIAEFGTKKYYEDLEDLYGEIKDEIEDALPEAYEPIDMAYEAIYENSDDEVFHTEYYHNQDANMPSIVIRIAPDGKRNTLFLRIGKR